jgi:hypothetical protein
LWEKLMVKWQLVCGYWPKPWHLVNPKIAGKWMFIPLELMIIGFDPPPYHELNAFVRLSFSISATNRYVVTSPSRRHG